MPVKKESKGHRREEEPQEENTESGETWNSEATEESEDEDEW